MPIPPFNRIAKSAKSSDDEQIVTSEAPAALKIAQALGIAFQLRLFTKLANHQIVGKMRRQVIAKSAGKTAAVRQGSRYSWMDIARGFAVLLVIIVHSASIYGFVGNELPKPVKLIGFAMAPFRMPLLIFLSGFLLQRSFQKGLFLFAYGKFRNLFWPFAVWTIIYCLVMGTPNEILRHPVWTGNSYLWYMAFLLFYFGVAAIFARIPPLAMAAYAFAISIAAPDGSVFGERLFVLMGYFFVGAYAGGNLRDFTKIISSNSTIFVMPLIVLVGAFSVLMGPVNFSPAYSIIALPALVAICSALYHIQDLPISKSLKYIGENSLVFYVIHVPLFIIINKIMEKTSFYNIYIVIPISMISAIFFGIIINIARKRWSYVQLLFSAPDFYKPGNKVSDKIRSMVDALPLLPRQKPSDSILTYSNKPARE